MRGLAIHLCGPRYLPGCGRHGAPVQGVHHGHHPDGLRGGVHGPGGLLGVYVQVHRRPKYPARRAAQRSVRRGTDRVLRVSRQRLHHSHYQLRDRGLVLLRIRVCVPVRRGGQQAEPGGGGGVAAALRGCGEHVRLLRGDSGPVAGAGGPLRGGLPVVHHPPCFFHGEHHSVAAPGGGRTGLRSQPLRRDPHRHLRPYDYRGGARRAGGATGPGLVRGRANLPGEGQAQNPPGSDWLPADGGDFCGGLRPAVQPRPQMHRGLHLLPRGRTDLRGWVLPPERRHHHRRRH
mmetsp:Transcript_17221/g.39377  ORF Transcript_17221/g.39377 Transcript_17221/m.39377 type:complete len:289 (+) Transcript_17221:383-1249(+)